MPPSGFKENAEDLNTGDPVQVDECAARAEPPELAAIRERVERDFVTDPASVSGVLSAELMQARIDRRALLANFDAELAEHAKPAPEMPRPPAEEARKPRGDATGSTGVSEPEKVAQAGESWIPSFYGSECPHRPEWTCPEHDECRACECDCNTYAADLEEPDLTLIPGDMVVRDPEICSGRPTMRGTRILASRIASELAAGTSWETLREWYPSLPSLPVPSTEEARDER